MMISEKFSGFTKLLDNLQLCYFEAFLMLFFFADFLGGRPVLGNASNDSTSDR